MPSLYVILIKRPRHSITMPICRLFYIHCFNAKAACLTNLVVPKERNDDTYAIRCMMSAFDENQTEALVFVEMEPIRDTLLRKALERLGATQVTIDSFSYHDYASAASTCLGSIEKKAESSGFRLIQRGQPSSYIRRSYGDVGEFDVVKKRRLMTENDDLDNEDCLNALACFEDFEAHVLPALLEVSRAYQKERLDEILQLEEEFRAGATPMQGLVYVAMSQAVQFPKIGATRRSDPGPRLRELSKSVPKPFQWVFYVRTFTPFKLESEIHSKFDAYRIREKGACTEFFDIDVASVRDYLKSRFELVDRCG